MATCQSIRQQCHKRGQQGCQPPFTSAPLFRHINEVGCLIVCLFRRDLDGSRLSKI